MNTGVRALAALFTVIYITHFTLFLAMLPSHAGIVAILVAAVVYDLRLTRGEPAGKAAKKLLGVKKPDAGKRGSAKPAKKPSGKSAEGKSRSKPAGEGSD